MNTYPCTDKTVSFNAFDEGECQRMSSGTNSTMTMGLKEAICAVQDKSRVKIPQVVDPMVILLFFGVIIVAMTLYICFICLRPEAESFFDSCFCEFKGVNERVKRTKSEKKKLRKQLRRERRQLKIQALENQQNSCAEKQMNEVRTVESDTKVEPNPNNEDDKITEKKTDVNVVETEC